MIAIVLCPGLSVTADEEAADGTGQVVVEDMPTPPITVEEEAAIGEEDVDDARQVVFGYLDARNNYDIESVLAAMEESYREEREEIVRGEVSQMRLFRTKLGVEEVAEPVITPEGTIEIRIKLTTPIGDRYVVYYMVQVDDEWKIGRPPE